MRRLKWIFLVAAVLALGFIRKSGAEQEQVTPAAVPTFGQASPQTIAGPEQAEDNGGQAKSLDSSFEDVAKLASKALASKAEKDQLRQILGDPDLQLQVFEAISADDASGFDVLHERRRMQATAFLGLIFQDTDIKGRDQVIRMAAERILTVNFKTMTDPRQKQSILGDVVEIMQSLKRFDPETFQSVANSIDPTNKPLHHAMKVAG